MDVTDFVAVNHWTAHPHVDDDGSVYNMGTSYGSKGMTYNVIKFPSGISEQQVILLRINMRDFLGESSFERAKVVASFPVRWRMSSSYYHSFAMTENYFVFVESPLVLNLLKFLTSRFRQVPMMFAFDWFPNERVRADC